MAEGKLGQSWQTNCEQGKKKINPEGVTLTAQAVNKENNSW